MARHPEDERNPLIDRYGHSLPPRGLLIEDEASSEGLRCYALKQANLWERLGETSKNLFTTALRTLDM